MIPQLKPDIFRCIASHVTPGTAPPHNGAHVQAVVYQQTVLSMMKSCKVRSSIVRTLRALLMSQMLHKIFAPMLYTRCRIKNLSSILVSLEHDNEMIKKIEHLDL
jgi:hypothetical protein